MKIAQRSPRSSNAPYRLVCLLALLGVCCWVGPLGCSSEAKDGGAKAPAAKPKPAKEASAADKAKALKLNPGERPKPAKPDPAKAIHGVWVGADVRLSDPDKVAKIKADLGEDALARMRVSAKRAFRGKTLKIEAGKVTMGDPAAGRSQSFEYTVDSVRLDADRGEVIVLKTVEAGGKEVKTDIWRDGDDAIVLTDDDAIKGMEVTFAREGSEAAKAALAPPADPAKTDPAAAPANPSK